MAPCPAPPPTLLEDGLGPVIRRLGLRHGLTWARVAEQAGLSSGQLSKIETGQTRAGTGTLARIARAPGVLMGLLFNNNDASGTSTQQVEIGAGMEMVHRGTKS